MRTNMSKKLPKIILMIAIILGIILIVAVFFNKEDAISEKNKNKEEVEYLDTKLISLINYLNNIELQNYNIAKTKVEAKSDKSDESSSKDNQNEEGKDGNEESAAKEETQISKMEEQNTVPENEEIDWETIEVEIENLYSIWPAIVLDLYNLNINSQDIIEFSNTLDETIVNIKKKDKALSAMYIAKLYSYLPSFLDTRTIDEITRKTLESKTYIISSYAFAETQNFDKMAEEIEKAESIFTGLVNSVSFINDKRKYNINKSYVLIEELKNSLSMKDTGIFYIKYKNVLQELNILF